jgi:hypothetical protein
MTKKVDERSKNDEKMTLSRTLKKKTKMEPGTGGENRGAEESQGAFMTRSRETTRSRKYIQKKKKTNHSMGMARRVRA